MSANEPYTTVCECRHDQCENISKLNAVLSRICSQQEWKDLHFSMNCSLSQTEHTWLCAILLYTKGTGIFHVLFLSMVSLSLPNIQSLQITNMIKTVFIILVSVGYFKLLNAACLYNTTHCQCSQGHDAGLCLRYESGSGNSATCFADDCSSVAYKCDCMGSSVCPLHSCTKWKWSSTPTSSATITKGDRVTCSSEQGICEGLPTNDIVTPCIHNSTHCQCGPGHDGGLCLRFLSGTSSSANCVVENCLDGGHKCDCMGDGMCALHSCGSWSSVTKTSLLVVGATVPCSYSDALSQTARRCASLM